MSLLRPACAHHREAILVVLAATTVLSAQSAIAQKKPSSGVDSHLSQADERMNNDPNLPGVSAQDFSRGLAWDRVGPTLLPKVTMPQPYNRTGHPDDYLGYTSEGSFIKGGDGKVYLWNLPPRAQKGTLSVRYKSDTDIPLETLRQLYKSANPTQVDYLIGRLDPSFNKQPAQVAQQPQPNTDGGAMGEMVRQAVAENGGLGLPSNPNQQAATVGSTIHGVDASVKNGVLSYTGPDGKRASLKVTPPPGGSAAGSTGTWFAYDADGKKGNDLQATVMSDGTVNIAPLSQQLKQMMEQVRAIQGGRRQ